LLSDKSDEELMIAYQLGETEAFEELYSRHAAKVMGYLRKKVRSEAVAQDIFQSAFLKLHRNRGRYNTGLPFAPWLFTLCRSELLDGLKKAHLCHETLVEELPDILTEPHRDSEEVCLHGLPEGQRRALELRYFRDFSFEEIAKSLDTSPANARQLISRAIRSLRGLYGK
jgi:RNA polymerase sigma-70 factor (ECF subfamily)